MKVLALNSSPRTGNVSKTEIMLDRLVLGMQEAGAEVEVVNLKDVKINHCIGCFTCWSKTPGICIHKDDMTRDLFPKLLACDLCILATPLYHYTVNARMKVFIERTLPIAQPFFVERDGVTSHPLRHEPPSLAVLSVAGFPELSVFDQLSSYVKFLYRDRLAAEIYRPSAELLRAENNDKASAKILEATVQGGRELATSMKISPETLSCIQREVTRFEEMAPIGNLVWQTCIDEGVTMGEFQKRNMVPRPDSIETFLMLMRFGFDPEKASDTRMSMQYNFSGQIDGRCYLAIENSKLTAASGTLDDPDLTINTPFDVWMDILTKKADGAQMLMQGKYTVEGDAGLLMNLSQIFG